MPIGEFIIGEHWNRAQSVTVAVKQRLVPGVGIITTDLAANLPHQWIRRGFATSFATSQTALRANEGQSSAVQVMDTIRFGKFSMWLVNTQFPNPENRYDATDITTQIMEFVQIWQEAPVPLAV